MVAPKKIFIKKHMSLKSLKKKIRNKEKDVRVLNKLHFIRACYHNDNIPEVAKEQDLPISTAYRWINEWNEGGYEGLKPKYCGGKKPGLNYDDKLKLFEILYFKDVVTTEIVHQTIKEEFGIDYSKKQAREIAKSIGFTFSSSYPVNVEVDPKKVKKFFDEVAELDYFNQIIGFLDQTACQDSSNVPKTLNIRGFKNRMKKHGVKIRQTAMGFQAINGNPTLSFPKNSRSPNMIRFAAEIRKNNVENKDLIPLIDLIFSNDNLNEENIIKILDKDLIDLEELIDKLQIRLDDKSIEDKDTLIKLINEDVKKADKNNKDKIQKFTLKTMIENLEESNIHEMLKDEKEIVIILDNYQPHKNTEFKKACEILKIKLIYLPPYCPHLNPIEQVWRTVKRVVHTSFFDTKEELIKIFNDEFFKVVNRSSFFKKWVNRYIFKVDIKN